MMNSVPAAVTRCIVKFTARFSYSMEMSCREHRNQINTRACFRNSNCWCVCVPVCVCEVWCIVVNWEPGKRSIGVMKEQGDGLDLMNISDGVPVNHYYHYY